MTRSTYDQSQDRFDHGQYLAGNCACHRHPFHVAGRAARGGIPYRNEASSAGSVLRLAIAARTGDIYGGLWYPVIAALVSVSVGLFAVPKTLGRHEPD